jgi:hypothetical protein
MTICFSLPPHSPDGFLFCRGQRRKLATHSADACMVIIQNLLITVLITHMCHVRRLTTVEVGPYMLYITPAITSVAGRLLHAQIAGKIDDVHFRRLRSIIRFHTECRAPLLLLLHKSAEAEVFERRQMIGYKPSFCPTKLLHAATTEQSCAFKTARGEIGKCLTASKTYGRCFLSNEARRFFSKARLR